MNSVTFKQAVAQGATTTTNGMPALESTGSELVDLFFTIGAARNMNGFQLQDKFDQAFKVDPLNTMKILFWARDVRGGAGERQTFRNIVSYLHQTDPGLVERNLHNIPLFGRWDDVLCLQRNDTVRSFIANTLLAQKDGYQLCAKWMPRQGHFAMEMAKFMKVSHKNWRKLLVHSSNTVEQRMCAQDWTGINYSHVPSIAAKMYQKAFGLHDAAGYAKYKEQLATGEAKINAGAIFPHDVIRGIRNGDEVVGQAQWDALPNYMGENSALAMIDTSGSMGCQIGGNESLRCIDVALALGLYVAEKQTGAFKDTYLTFSAKPKLANLVGSTVKEKLDSMDMDDWNGNTDIEAAFDKILQVAVMHKVPAIEMPQFLIIMSDMQFDYCCKDPSATALEYCRARFTNAGYDMPKVVFWNLNAHDNKPCSFSEQGTALISGFSPAIMKAVLAAKSLTPYDLMMDTLNNERYNGVVA